MSVGSFIANSINSVWGTVKVSVVDLKTGIQEGAIGQDTKKIKDKIKAKMAESATKA